VLTALPSLFEYFIFPKEPEAPKIISKPNASCSSGGRQIELDLFYRYEN